MARMPDSTPVQTARGAGRDFVYSTAFEVLSRAGFVARGLIYAIIGVLAFQVAVSDAGKLTNQEGALRTVADKPLGGFLLVVLAIGLGGYSIWRLFRAALGHGPEAADSTLDRLGGLGSGLVYGALSIAAIKILSGSTTKGASSTPDQTTAGVFDWPAGRLLVGVAGRRLLACGVGENDAVGAQFAVQTRDAIQIELEQPGRGDGAGGKHPRLFHRAGEGEVAGVHSISLLAAGQLLGA